jgi:hypothetical protein
MITNYAAPCDIIFSFFPSLTSKYVPWHVLWNVRCVLPSWHDARLRSQTKQLLKSTLASFIKLVKLLHLFRRFGIFILTQWHTCFVFGESQVQIYNREPPFSLAREFPVLILVYISG